MNHIFKWTLEPHDYQINMKYSVSPTLIWQPCLLSPLISLSWRGSLLFPYGMDPLETSIHFDFYYMIWYSFFYFVTFI